MGVPASPGLAIGRFDAGHVMPTPSAARPSPQMIYNVLEQDPGREFILAAASGAGRHVQVWPEAIEGRSNKKLCELSTAIDPTFRDCKVGSGPQCLEEVHEIYMRNSTSRRMSRKWRQCRRSFC